MKAGVVDNCLRKINGVQLATMELPSANGTVAKIDVSIDAADGKGADIKHRISAVLCVRDAVERYPLEERISEKARRKTILCCLVIESLVDNFSSIEYFIAVLSIAGFRVLLR